MGVEVFQLFQLFQVFHRPVSRGGTEYQVFQVYHLRLGRGYSLFQEYQEYQEYQSFRCVRYIRVEVAYCFKSIKCFRYVFLGRMEEWEMADHEREMSLHQR